MNIIKKLNQENILFCKGYRNLNFKDSFKRGSLFGELIEPLTSRRNTKFEFGLDDQDQLVLMDEVSDSSINGNKKRGSVVTCAAKNYTQKVFVI